MLASSQNIIDFINTDRAVILKSNTSITKMGKVKVKVPALIDASRNGRTIKLQKGDFSSEVRSETSLPPDI